MPKQNINHENCLIYKITCKDEKCKDVYVGQTTDIIRRTNGHKSGANKKDKFLYDIINENGGWSNWKLDVVEKYPCKSKQEILDREQYWINNLQANLNTHIRYDPSEYKREWYFKNRERIQAHKESLRITKINEKNKYVINPENPPDWFLENQKYQNKKTDHQTL
jgi:hypothetical protein